MSKSSPSRRTASNLVALVLTLLSAAGAGAQTYRNPLGVDLADPDVLQYKGLYYLYGTSAPSEGFEVWASPDLVHWQNRGFAFRRNNQSWGKMHFWAPSIVQHNGDFYLYYSAVGPVPGRWSHRICVAKGNSPLGPFVDVKAPLLEVGRAVIDAETFVDADGRAYLYFSLDMSENPVSEICVVPLGPDLTSVAGPMVRCLRPSQPWEGTLWNEAPYVFRQGDTYIMTYSANGFFEPNYGIGYAIAKSPLGPWKKAENNPILHRTAKVSGPGHNCITRSPDGKEMFILYHVQKHLNGGIPRELAMDRLTVTVGVNGQVRLNCDGPSRVARALPSHGESKPAVMAVTD